MAQTKKPKPKPTWVNVGVTTVTIDGKKIQPGDKWKGDPPRHLVRNGSLRRKATP